MLKMMGNTLLVAILSVGVALAQEPAMTPAQTGVTEAATSTVAAMTQATDAVLNDTAKTDAGVTDPHEDDFDETVKASSMVGLSSSQQQQFTRLAQALRCLTCANASLEDSQSSFSIQVKMTLRQLVQKHMTDEQIYQQLSQTYGDQILYAPPLNPKTVLLWLGPVLLGLLLLVILWRLSTRKVQARHPRLEEALRVIRGES